MPISLNKNILPLMVPKWVIIVSNDIHLQKVRDDVYTIENVLSLRACYLR